jgi:hypothetical protein
VLDGERRRARHPVRGIGCVAHDDVRRAQQPRYGRVAGADGGLGAGRIPGDDGAAEQEGARDASAKAQADDRVPVRQLVGVAWPDLIGADGPELVEVVVAGRDVRRRGIRGRRRRYGRRRRRIGLVRRGAGVGAGSVRGRSETRGALEPARDTWVACSGFRRARGLVTDSPSGEIGGVLMANR